MVKRSSAPWTVTDGRAGNVRQAVALASALRQGTHRPLVLQPRAPWRWLSPRRLPGDVNGYGEAFATLAAEAPALAIGCGRQAAGALRVLRARGSQVVQILDPRIGARHWDVVVVPEHDALRGSNVLTLLGSLNPVDDDWLAWGRAAFAGFSTLPGPRTALLVGGPTPLAPWDETAMVGVFQALARQIRSEGGSLLATTSRRTPPALAEILRATFADLPHVIWGDGGDGTNPYGGLLGWANRVVVSPDSVNLLSEACATRMPVMVALADTAQGRLARFQQQLRERGRLQAHWLDWQYDRIEPLRETARVAAEVKQRLALG
ncbi:MULTISPECIES: mitochondrial fission ELM1 family protein [Stenotrophomonas]|uniref:mitochondrial fission ELM1 family protein n=1 Tax=Stenotrophomonas TaxID=40323 RepID=UPI00066AFE8C|nr:MULTISPECIES: mitochondrial fission ELM1 family protein [Stenotrophomonas]EKT4101622.1 mitochondrial fission ELM1 family protein [Stenotrophomonas maltophilia]MBA0261998.1 nucleoside-diphosphate sugar epimerase [Stenotrophomonas maltophilia]MBA0317344.1 nucleoside-diphosphate sugar epimerase [Stenotrophomonas maltophilia]MBB1136590.1 mitochondrial fission ELM1 family protein [Stenotrophomonas sp. I18B00994]MBH1667528.1 mitochondrial fission ELM1 family protein [Stenotrophomonas maltophilia]